MTLACHPPGGNPLPPCPAQPHLRRAIDGKDRCVSRQAPRDRPQTPPPPPPSLFPSPPSPARPHLGRPIDGKDRCVSRQARRTGRKALPAGLPSVFRRLDALLRHSGRCLGAVIDRGHTRL